MIHAQKVGAALLPAKKVGAPLDGPTFFTQTQKRLERQKRPQKGWTVPSFCTRQERRSNLSWMKKGWGVIRFGREAQKRLERRCRTGKRSDRRDAQARRSNLFDDMVFVFPDGSDAPTFSPTPKGWSVGRFLKKVGASSLCKGKGWSVAPARRKGWSAANTCLKGWCVVTVCEKGWSVAKRLERRALLGKRWSVAPPRRSNLLDLFWTQRRSDLLQHRARRSNL